MARQGTGQVIRNGDGSLTLRYSGGKNADGTRKVVNKNFANERELRAWNERRLSTNGSSVTLREWAETFFASYPYSTRSAHTIKAHLGLLAPELKTKGSPEVSLPTVMDVFGEMTLSDLEDAIEEIQAWRALFNNGKKALGHKRTRYFSQLLTAAVRARKMSFNPILATGLNPQPRAKPAGSRIFADRGEVDQVAAELGEWADLLVFGTETGLRPGELAGVHKTDILQRIDGVWIVDVQRSWDEQFGMNRRLKTDESRRQVGLTRRALRAAQSFSERRSGEILFAGPKGGYLNMDNWSERELKPSCVAAGIGWKATPNDMRDTFATWALSKGVDIYNLAKLMGNSVETIQRHYGHVTPKLAADAVALLDDAVDGQ